MIISASNIRQYAKLRFNVTDIDIYIEEAQEYLKKKMNSDLYDRMLVVSTYSAWSNATAYTAGNYVTYSGSLWKCLVGNTNSAPTSVNTNWDEQDIYEGFLILQKSLSYIALSKMLIEHGIEIQADGLVKYSGAESQTAVSSDERAALVNKYQNKGDSVFTEFLTWIDDVSYLVDTVSYPFTSSDIRKNKTDFGIF